MEMLDSLDAVLAASGDYEDQKMRNIEILKSKIRSRSSDIEKYALYDMVFNEYKTFLVDSAMKYAEICLEIAKEDGNPDYIADQHINRSFVLSASGLLKEAFDEIKQVDTNGLSDVLRKKYYGQMIYLYSHMGNFTPHNQLGNNYYALEKQYKDSVLSVVCISDPDYLWYKGWEYIGQKNSPEKEELATLLEHVLDQASFDTRADAMNAYVLARIYEENNDKQGYIDRMAASAIADIKSCNRDIASIEELSGIVFDMGQIDRAHKYINYCLQQAILYPNKLRTYSIAEQLDQINAAYEERNMQQTRRTHWFLIAVCVLSLILTATIGVIIFQMRRLRIQSSRIDDVNQQLHKHIQELNHAHAEQESTNRRLSELNDSLKQSNNDLAEANALKEEYISSVFMIYSEYIKKLEDFRKTINRKSRAHQYDDIVKMTASSDNRSELNEFYHRFDSIFLNIYPNFINDFNELLNPDEHIHPKEGELLNIELRIYALVSMGITESVKIAQFLNCSVQTVYNSRFKVRSKSYLPKDEFVAAVKALGKKSGPRQELFGL